MGLWGCAIALVTLCNAQMELIGIQVDGTEVCAGDHCASKFYYESPLLSVESIQPNGGPLQGGSEVRVHGTGIRDLVPLMRCKFGQVEVPATLHIPIGESFDPYNGDALVCISPPSDREKSVALEISLMGEVFTNNLVQFHYYEHPHISETVPREISNLGEELTVLGSGFSRSDIGLVLDPLCRFTAISEPEGNAQKIMDEFTLASILSDSEIVCQAPPSEIHGDVLLSLTLNGVDYTPTSISSTVSYADSWRKVTANGKSPDPREFASLSLVGCTNATSFTNCKVVLYGGWQGEFKNDLHFLDLDLMHEYYPSANHADWGWKPLYPQRDNSTAFAPRARHSSTLLGDSVFIYGGLTQFGGDATNDMLIISKEGHLRAVEQRSDSSFPRRASHSMLPVSIAGEEVLSLYGGTHWYTIRPKNNQTGYPERLAKRCASEVYLFHTGNNSWTLWMDDTSYSSGINGRFGHSAVKYDNQQVIFGGEACTSLESAYSSDLIVLDIERATLELLSVASDSSEPSGRAYHTSVVMNNKYHLMYGGFNDLGPQTDLWYFDLTQVASGTVSWHSIQPTGRNPFLYGMSAVTLPNQEILFWGGLTAARNNDLFLLALENDEFV